MQNLGATPIATPTAQNDAAPFNQETASESGAGDAIRTRDHLLGRQMLYP